MNKCMQKTDFQLLFFRRTTVGLRKQVNLPMLNIRVNTRVKQANADLRCKIEGGTHRQAPTGASLNCTP